MTYKQLEMVREARLWAGQIIVPLVIGGVTLWSIPEVRNNIINQANNAKNFVEETVNKFRNHE